MRINNSGNLGLGVTPSAWNSNSRALQLSQFVSLSHQNNASLNLMSFALETSANAFTYAETGAFPLRYNQNPNNGDHSWYVAPTGTSGNTITFTQAMTLDASGRLGIGTPSPSARLHVANSAGGVVAFLQSTATNGEPSLNLEGRNSSGTVRNGIFKYDNADILRIGTSSPISFRFETNDTERMRITSGGNVLIGTTTDSGQILQVNGNLTINNTLSSPGNLIETAGLNVYLRPASGYSVFIDTGNGLTVTNNVRSIVSSPVCVGDAYLNIFRFDAFAQGGINQANSAVNLRVAFALTGGYGNEHETYDLVASCSNGTWTIHVDTQTGRVSNNGGNFQVSAFSSGATLFIRARKEFGGGCGYAQMNGMINFAGCTFSTA
jgi:hypothetical protein